MIEGFIGIIGALAGVFVGHFLKRIGKINMQITSFELNYYVDSPLGDGDSITEKENATSIKYSLEARFINTKELEEGISDVRIHFLDSKRKEIHQAALNDDSKTISSRPIIRLVEVETLDLPPKRVVIVKGRNASREVKNYIAINYLYLSAKDYKGRLKKSKLFKIS